ncbi:hypothetical protein R1flu_023369 [Riccia fluitans]|uniref:Uncharacterized protein n=1 Tax=Riccia fluitans TaxID=41844 RepID=A0ABD1XRU8_9MARC
MDRSHCVEDYSTSNKRGVAIIMYSKHAILRSGIRGDGTFVWAIIHSSLGELGVASIYGPSYDRQKRAKLFEWLRNFWQQGQWFIMDDWNMVLLRSDTVGLTPLAYGHELDR